MRKLLALIAILALTGAAYGFSRPDPHPHAKTYEAASQALQIPIAKPKVPKIGFWGQKVLEFTEGYHPCRYNDPIGIPTICFGHTNDMQGIDHLPRCLSGEECRALLERDLSTSRQCLINNVDRMMEQHESSAYQSLTFNIGCGTLRKSSPLRHYNDGNIGAACNTFNLYVYAGGKKFNGLIKRRKLESTLCYGDFDALALLF